MTRKILAALMVTLVSLSAIPDAKASAVYGTRVTTVYVLETQSAIISFANPTGSTCTASGFYFDISTAKGKAFLTLATAALLSNVLVEAYGSGTCTTPSGASYPGETLTGLNVHNQ